MYDAGTEGRIESKCDYLRTVKNRRFPNRSEMREFGKVYGDNEIYIKIRVELLDAAILGNHTVFIMSFHYAERPFSEEVFPYPGR